MLGLGKETSWLAGTLSNRCWFDPWEVQLDMSTVEERRVVASQ